MKLGLFLLKNKKPFGNSIQGKKGFLLPKWLKCFQVMILLLIIIIRFGI